VRIQFGRSGGCGCLGGAVHAGLRHLCHGPHGQRREGGHLPGHLYRWRDLHGLAHRLCQAPGTATSLRLVFPNVRMSRTTPTHRSFARAFSTPSRCSFPGATCSTLALPSRTWARLLDSCPLPTRSPVRSAFYQLHSNHGLTISNSHPNCRPGLPGLLNCFIVCAGSPRHRFHRRRRHARRHHRAQQLQWLGLVR
jgi:hypothetical protein